MKFKALIDTGIDYTEEIKKLLLEGGYEVYVLSAKKLLLDEIDKGQYNIVFLRGSCSDCADITGPNIKNIKKSDPRAEIICIGDKKDDASAIEAIKKGATACFGSPVDPTLLSETISKIKELATIRKETFQIETSLNEKYIFADMVSKNPAMLDIFSLMRRVAPYYRTVLIIGGTGTGKELLAKAVHNFSSAAKEPFVACNCSGLVETLIESELFGHVKGAFTGAVSDKKGLFEAAGNGVIFLDEIGEMPLSFQSHFLRVLQDGEFRRLGSAKSMKANCKVIAATNVELYDKVKKGLFREDLFFRLAVITIKLPELKERKEDIPLLYSYFLNKIKTKLGKDVRGITMDAKHLLMSYNWPGNIRELENVIERAVLVTPVNFIRAQDLPAYIKESTKKDSPASLTLNDLEKNHIQSVLTTTGGNKTKAASILGISRRALLRKINKYNLK